MTLLCPRPSLASVLPDPVAERRWLASLQLGLVADATHTRLQQMQFEGPLRVQRAFYPEGDLCHLYLLHPPGGLVSGDRLRIDVQAHANSHCLLTTPSAGKVYRADSANIAQHQQVHIQVAAGASVEWLPMETLVYDGANGVLNTRIDLQTGAVYMGLDMVCIGRPASDLPFLSGRAEQRLSLYQDGRPLLLERLLLGGNTPLWQSAAGFRGAHVVGTLVVAGLSQPQQAVEQLREQMPELAASAEEGLFSVTSRLGLLLVRYLGNNSEYGNRLLRRAWAELRPLLLQRPACPPRIWAT